MLKRVLAVCLAVILTSATLALAQGGPQTPPPNMLAENVAAAAKEVAAQQVAAEEVRDAATEQTPPANVPPPQTPPPTPPESPQPGETPNVLSDAASGAYQRRDSLPSVNVYLPEGQASVRLRKLIRNVLFESQIDYEFVNGDISTFLRYKYYARNYTYRIGVFDSIEFPDLGSSSDEDFERVRGGLLLVGVPKDYNNRYFVLLQDDQLTFGDLTRPDNRTSNIYAKVGYQYGTQFDERMNAIVGEQRGRITPVLTAFRDIGPQRTGFAAAITQAGRVLSSDYQYTKLEAEALRRTDVTATSFLFTRLHVGSFLSSEMEADRPPECDIEDFFLNPPDDGEDDEEEEEEPEVDELEQWECFAIPQYELFRLGGREALKSIRSNDRSIGIHELHLTNEFFFPVFRNRDYKMGAIHWNTLYAVGYVGAGAVGFEFDQMADRFVVDAGIGTESAITYGDWDVYLSVLYSMPVHKPDEIEKGRGFRFAIRTVR